MTNLLNIDDIDFTKSGTKIFEATANINLEQLNWTRGQYLRVEADKNYSDVDTIWIRMDKYPTLTDESPIVARNGRYYETTISVVRGTVLILLE